jgi:16S rRNA (guanine527-N7)-methyltransferase
MFGPEEFAEATHVSRETLARLKAYVGLLTDWNTRHNLVSDSTLSDVWLRHVYDSAQLDPLIPPGARTLADLGSGAGFPGLVLALLREGKITVTLFEATGKKCDFLRAAAEKMKLTVAVRNQRAEETAKQTFDVITARACAPLPKLLSYAQHIAGKNTVCLFLKGQNAEAELTEAGKFWRMKTVRHPSRTHEKGVILELSQLRVAIPRVRS